MNRFQKLFRVSETAAIMSGAICVLVVFFLAAGHLVIKLFYGFEQPLPYTLGLLLGGLLSVSKVILLEKSLEHSLDMEGKKAQGYAGLQATLRYLLTIGVFLLVFLFPHVFGLFGAIIGVLSLQGAAYLTNFVLNKRPPA